MSRKPSMQQYEELGKELAFLCARLSAITCKLGQETGVSKEPYKHAAEAARSLDKAKLEAEELLFLHYPDLGREAIGIFYRKPEDPQEELK